MADAKRADEFRAALTSLRRPLGAALLFSGAINVLYLASPLYMLQIYGRVMNSGSVPTLVGLTVIVLVALSAMSLLEYIRSKVLVRVAGQFERQVSHRVFESVVRQSLPGQRQITAAQILRDLDQFRGLIGGPTLAGLFDLPWTPVFILVLFILHPLFGLLGLVGALALGAMTWMNLQASRRGQRRVDAEAQVGYRFATAAARSAEAVRAMGMTTPVRDRWYDDRSALLVEQAQARDTGESWAAGTRLARLILQTLTLGLGAWLVLQHSVQPGAIFAAGLLTGRALAPLVLAVNGWSQLDSSGDAVLRLRKLLSTTPAEAPEAPAPDKPPALLAHDADYVAPGGKRVLHDINIALAPGRALGVIGPSASGKSTLLRMLSGVLPPQNGEVKLFEEPAAHWSRAALGRRIGYVPQEIALLPGTLRENIARFDPEAPEGAVEAAVEAAGVHDLVERFDNGLETAVETIAEISGGELQRLALARALYRDPDLLIFDEPDANLDDAGEDALIKALTAAKERGTTIVVATHRTPALETVDDILVLREGRIFDAGTKEDVVARFGRRANPPPPREPVRQIEEQVA